MVKNYMEENNYFSEKELIMKSANKVKKNIRNAFPALTHKNFRYFWFGQCISLIGTWMQTTGQSWLVLTLTDSTLKLGYVSALQFTPMLLFSLFAGVIIDRYPKKKILLITQSMLAVLAASLTILVWSGHIKFWHILILATMLGFVNTIDMPTRQSFMIELVGKEDLMNAIALNSSIFNAARLLGPAVAGILMHRLGFTYCFLLNSLSFIPVIYGIYSINVVEKINNKQNQKEDEKKNILVDIKEGLIYIFKKPLLFRTLFLIAVVGIFAMNYNVLIPPLAKNVLNQNGEGFGLLMSSLGLGSLIGALTVAVKSKGGPKQKTLFSSSIIIAFLLVIMGFSKNFYLSALLLMITGFFNISFSTTANSTMQLNSEDKFRGRVMSVYALVFGGVTPIGSLFSGMISNYYGVSITFIISGLITLILTIVILTLRKKVINIS